MESIDNASAQRTPWNKGKLVGQKAPLKHREIWAIRIRLQLAEPRTRELALFNLAVDAVGATANRNGSIRLRARRWRLRCASIGASLCRPKLIGRLATRLGHSLRPQCSQQRGVLAVIEPVAHSFHDEKAHNQRE